MKTSLLTLLALISISITANAQAFKTINIESSEHYYQRKSGNYDNNPYSNYYGPKSYIDIQFVNKNGDIMFSFRANGRVVNYKDGVQGYYFIAPSESYKRSDVYIRWDHGGELKCELDYSRRSDGKPYYRHKVSYGSGTLVYAPSSY